MLAVVTCSLFASSQTRNKQPTPVAARTTEVVVNVCAVGVAENVLAVRNVTVLGAVTCVYTYACGIPWRQECARAGARVWAGVCVFACACQGYVPQGPLNPNLPSSALCCSWFWRLSESQIA